MEKKFRITAKAPTVYQFGSLMHFGMNYRKPGNGSFIASEDFYTEDEAKEYLKQRAEKYNDEDPCGSEQRMQDMYDDIENGTLTLDAVTGYIEEIEYLED